MVIISERSRHPLLRLRYQLLGGLICAIGLPLLVRMATEPSVVFSVNHQVTIIAAIVAHIGGYVTYKRLHAFPGAVAFSTILPAFALSYGLVFIAIFFLRLDYSRFQAAGSFLVSSMWYFGLYSFSRSLEPYKLAYIPVGAVDKLTAIKDVVWRKLETPEATPKDVYGVVADLRADLPSEWERFLMNCVLSGTPVYHVKQTLESLTGRVAIEHLSENTLGSLNPNQVYWRVKRLLDFLFALIALVLLSPVFLILAVVIRLETPGTAFFRQERVGHRGVPFTLYKFRTMRNDVDTTKTEKEKAITTDGDARITRIGRILRKTRLDELPQAINVLRGEMSWIGPRPEAAVLSKWYEEELPFYQYRHIVLPGITGWAQVSQGHVHSVDDVNEKLYYDFYYIKNFSLWLDVVIVVRTIKIMLTGFGAR